MVSKYKFIYNETGKVMHNVKNYFEEENQVKLVVLDDYSILTYDKFKTCKYLENVNGYDVYSGDKAIVRIESDYVDENGHSDSVVYTGCFVEHSDSGLFFFKDEKTNNLYPYKKGYIRVLNL